MSVGSLTSAFGNLPTITTTVLVSVCMVTDIARRRIYNVATFPAAIVGLALGIVGGWQGFVSSVEGLVVGFALMILPYYVGGMGAGDVKLMAAVGALMGLPAIFQIFLYTAIIGGVMAVASALLRGTLKRALRNIYTWTTSLVLQRMGGVRAVLKDTQLEQTAGMIPYGVAIALGFFSYLAFGSII